MAKATTPAAAPVDPDARFRVTINDRFPAGDITFLPSHDNIIVDAGILAAMQTAGVVDNVQPA
jgi:hypothetical protein